MERWLPADCNGALALSDKIMVSTISLLLINIMVFAQCQVTQTIKRMLQVSIICMNQLTMFGRREFLRYWKIATPHLWGAIRTGVGLYAVALYAADSETPHPVIGVRGTKHRKDPLSWTFWKVSFRTMPPLIQTRISGASSMLTGLASYSSLWTRCCWVVEKIQSDWRT